MSRSPDSERPRDFDLLLPTQIRRARYETPARRLAMAVLATAVEDLGGERAELARKAAAWVEEDDPVWPFSFVNLCGVLGLEPSGVRRYLAGRLAA